MRCWPIAMGAALLGLEPELAAEDIFRETFEGPTRPAPLRHIWGDRPSAVAVHATEPKIGLNASAAAHLRLTFPEQLAHHLTYWAYLLADPVPIVPSLESISYRVRSNVPVSIKIGISPYGFIYHGPGVKPSPEWQTVRVDQAYEVLKAWCAKGEKPVEGAAVSQVIVALTPLAKAEADVIVDEIALEGPPGAAEAVRQVRWQERVRKVRVAAVSLIWDQGYRTLPNVLEALDEAGEAGADIACLPERCVDAPAEPIPGPLAEAIAARAAKHRMYVVGNLLEKDGSRTYVTSFLCDRQGRLAGKYRKSHRLPYETEDLGDDLPVFATDFGAVGFKIGTDHYFSEIDWVLRRRGATLIVWSTSPFPVRDEYTIDSSVRGRAAELGCHYVIAQYAGKKGYGGYPEAFSWTASWPLGRAQVIGPDGNAVADSGHAGGVAVATVPRSRLGGSPTDGGLPVTGKYAELTQPKLPAPRERTAGLKRTIRACVIECEPNIDRLLAKLDKAGQSGCDIACLWEYVWYATEAEVKQHYERNTRWLQQIAEAARRHQMYIVIAGELQRGFNEAILFDRQGREMGRYTKINQTTDKKWSTYQEGDRVGIFDTDFGRICTKICADVYSPEIDRVAALYQVDLMLHHTQDAGPYTGHCTLRERRRCIDDGYFLLRANGAGAQSDHRTYIMDPWGVVLASTQRGVSNDPVVVRLDLDSRPPYYEWPEEVRQSGPYPDGYQRGRRPEAKGDLRAVVLQCRRPELYKPRPDKDQKP